MRKTFEKKEKGITLIALVITIIVLLILAGITIASLTGENGILNKTIEAKENTTIGGEKEKISLAYDVVKTDKIDGTSTGAITPDEIKAEIKKQGEENVSAVAEGELIKITFTVTGNEYTIDSNGNIIDIDPIIPSEDYLNLREGDEVIYTDKNGNEIQCVVLYDAESSRSYANQNYGVQIIPKSYVGSVKLGDLRPVGWNYGEPWATYALECYNDAIGILNRATEDYLNTDLAIDSRCVGSIPNNKNYKNENMYSSDYEGFQGWQGLVEDEDENYKVDKTKMDELGIAVVGQHYYLASRCIIPDSSRNPYLAVRTIRDTRNELTYADFLRASWEGSSGTTNWALRPVFTLKPNVKIEEKNGYKYLIKGE